ncbi:histidine phosphatase family protein [Mycolicibacter sp. MYC123]|uniref:Histidine phosphatase family protein n=2 Tax=Mycolicibacter TaxID=1073531 RepID=A0ABU5YJI0_9MYCO|nr:MULTISPECIES: histidine phosphatase family protein [unclassified Mycolicibacter]MEB3050197.1 histidine phosphatase family protein [Mycolicibacter sp. MYC123]MEB3063732.1 histidine phosphatase family protein [Mycolicibacter sp. MYC101]MEB3069426.1 histidine phosphatase family protein [Mycolicibacter sp. MYC017]
MKTNSTWPVAAGIVLVGAGVIGTPAPAHADVAVRDAILTSGEAQDIVIDIVRHGQRMPPFNDVITPSPDHPGPPLSDLGVQQAHDIGQKLFDELGPVSGIFSGEAIRDIDTATPFAELENMTPQILSGLNEIDSGIYAGQPIASLSGFLYQFTPMLWTLFGLVLVPIPGSVEDPNGVVMNQNFTEAVNTMYTAAMANPVVSDNGDITAVAFNNEADIAAWVALNVKNPDISLLLPLTLQTMFANDDGSPLLPNTGVVQIEGNPTDGWTLVSWNGVAVPEDPGLLTKLIMDVRDLITTPQVAGWNLYQALLGGDPTAIDDALQTGLQDIASTFLGFPQAVFTDITDALSNLGAGDETGSALGDLLAWI